MKHRWERVYRAVEARLARLPPRLRVPAASVVGVLAFLLVF